MPGTTRLTGRQRQVLEQLLDQYERSRTYKGENQVRQSFSLSPARVYEPYEDNYTSVQDIEAFEAEMRALQEMGLVSLVWKSNAIARISAVQTEWNRYYAYLSRRPLAETVAEQKKFYENWTGRSAVTDAVCRQQLERIGAGKKVSYTPQEAEPILKLLVRITENRTDILERELSIAVLGDSKLFEQRYRSRICRILETCGNVRKRITDIEDKREREIALLEEYSVYANPSYVYVKGNGCFRLNDTRSQACQQERGTQAEQTSHLSGQNQTDRQDCHCQDQQERYCQQREITLHADVPMAFASETLRNLTSVEIREGSVMTVENLTSFNRMRAQDTFLIYLAGYHNTAKQRLIRKIAQDNPNLSWMHFGDIDPDGFLILENLKKGTGLDIQPWHMGIAELEKYRKYTKPLQKNDLVKAQSLIQAGLYVNIAEYMIQHNCKLEQEIVSWMQAGE